MYSMSVGENKKDLEIIGKTTHVEIGDIIAPAKIDTGANSTSIWASDIKITKSGTLKFKLFAPKSKFYTGETIETKNYTATIVTSSNGQDQIRYRVQIPIKIGTRKIKANVTLADRSNNQFPILIGRKTLSGRFLVDVRQGEAEKPQIKLAKDKLEKIRNLNSKLAENPLNFHKEHIKPQINSKQEKDS